MNPWRIAESMVNELGPAQQVRNVQLTTMELDQLLGVLEKHPELHNLEQKIYKSKLKKESPMGGGGAEDADTEEQS